MRKLLSLLSVCMCALLLCSCIYYPTTSKTVTEVVSEYEVGGDAQQDDSSNDDFSNSELTDDTSSPEKTAKKAPLELMKDEIIPQGNTAILMKNLSGKSDSLAEIKRNNILNAADKLKKSGAVYYVSAKNGDDDNNGLSPETAWQTPDAIASNAWQFKAGDTILFERGSVFRLKHQIFCKSGVTYGAYGKGPKPVLYGSQENYAKAGYWQPSTKANVWKLNLQLPDAGIVVFNHGESVGYKQGGLLSVTKNGDYYHNVAENTLYLYLDKGRPNKVYKDIEIGTKTAVFTLNNKTNNVTIDNICMKYSGNFGIQAIGFHDNITISNCEIGWIGGSYQIDGKTIRYGNGIQFWDTASNITVDNCWVYQCYDTGITFQGNYFAVYDNVKFINNLVEYCTMSFEFWDQSVDGVRTEPDGDMRNILISNNISRFVGYGWGAQRPNPMMTCHIQAEDYYDYYISGMTISNNIFDTSTHSIFMWGYAGDSKKDDDIVIKGNTYYQGASQTPNLISIPGTGWLNATNQSEFESCISKVDIAPKEVKWLT